jgi:hypothetical protein
VLQAVPGPELARENVTPAIPSGADRPTAAPRSVAVDQVCFSLGRVERRGGAGWYHAGPKLRATVPSSVGREARLEFKFLGSTPEPVALASGVVREQIGLKLFARDSCNVVYVMWRFGARPSIVASAKANPGTQHSECRNRGYRTLRPIWAAPVEVPVVGSVHALWARIDAGVIEVRIDDRPVLRAAYEPGSIPPIGEAGLRSDNVRFELLEFDAIERENAGPSQSPYHCQAAEDEGD